MGSCFSFRQKVAVDVGTYRMRVATGTFRLLETPSLSAMHAGVVVDAVAAAERLQPLLASTRTLGIVSPLVLACAPSDVAPEERERLLEALVKAGAASAVIVPEPLAAAIGADMDVSQPYAQMVVDIGEGVTDCAIIRSSRLLAGHALRIGCAMLRSAVVAQCNVSIGQAEELLRNLGVEPESDRHGSARLLQNDMHEKYRAAVKAVMEVISATVIDFLKNMPVTVGAQIIDSGIVLTGGGALIPGMRKYIEIRTRVRTTCSSSPMTDVVMGAHAVLPVVTALKQWP